MARNSGTRPLKVPILTKMPFETVGSCKSRVVPFTRLERVGEIVEKKDKSFKLFKFAMWNGLCGKIPRL